MSARTQTSTGARGLRSVLPKAKKKGLPRQERGRVLLVGSFVSRSAYSSVGSELANRLSDQGWRVICTSRKQQALQKLADMLLTCWKERHSYDVAYVEVYSGRAFFWAEAVCTLLRVLGKPYIAAMHGGNLPSYTARNQARVWRLISEAGAVVCPSPYLSDAFASKRPDLQLIPNAINTAAYPWRVRRAPRPKLVWLRALRNIYDPETAVRVLGAVRQRYPEAQLTVIGPDRGDGTRERTEKLVAALDLTGHVEFIFGVPKDEVGSYLSRGDIFLNTSTIDNTPVSVVEAMACGLCIVSSNVGGVPRLITDELDGLLVPPGDADAMTAAVLRILDDPSFAESLSLNAHRKARTFDWAAVTPLWNTLLSEILEAHLSY